MSSTTRAIRVDLLAQVVALGAGGQLGDARAAAPRPAARSSSATSRMKCRWRRNEPSMPLQHAVQRHGQRRQARRLVPRRQAHPEVAVAGDLVGGVCDVLHQLVLDRLREPAAVRQVQQPERHGDERQTPRAGVPRDRGEEPDGDVAEPTTARSRATARAAPRVNGASPCTSAMTSDTRAGVDQRADARARARPPATATGSVGSRRLDEAVHELRRPARRSRPARALNAILCDAVRR